MTLVASKTEADLIKIKAKLNIRFKITDLRKLSWFLGIQFECKNITIRMNQDTLRKYQNLTQKIVNHAQPHVKWI